MRRDEIAPLACWTAFIVFMFVVVSASIAPAGAAPVTPGEVYAHDHSADICMELDTKPTIPGVEALLSRLQDEQGLDLRESAVAVVTSVIDNCRIHENLLRQFAAHYRGQRA